MEVTGGHWGKKLCQEMYGVSLSFILPMQKVCRNQAAWPQRNPPKELCRQCARLSGEQEPLSIRQLWGLAEIKLSLCPLLTSRINHPVPSVLLLLTPAWPLPIVRQFLSESQNKRAKHLRSFSQVSASKEGRAAAEFCRAR